jgi:4'-phosphopantetheinyl transferase
VDAAERAVEVVSVWLVRTDPPAGPVDHLASFLDAQEHARAEAMIDPRRRAQYVMAHSALRLIVGAALGEPAADLRWRRGPHGKPLLAEEPGRLHFNLSTCDELALVATSPGTPVGVDVERILSDHVASRMARRYFSASEAEYVLAAEPPGRAERFATLWTRKEAYGKARGGRLAEALPVPLLDASAPAAAVRDLAAPPGFRAAVAVPEAGAAFRVRQAEWTGWDEREERAERDEPRVRDGPRRSRLTPR